MKKRVGIYLRVSTDGQTTGNQRRELEAVAARSSWEIVGFYEDAGISGAKGRDKRPAFDRLMKDATARKIDMIAAWSVDRLGRSLQDLVGFLGELRAVGWPSQYFYLQCSRHTVCQSKEWPPRDCARPARRSKSIEAGWQGRSLSSRWWRSRCGRSRRPW